MHALPLAWFTRCTSGPKYANDGDQPKSSGRRFGKILAVGALGIVALVAGIKVLTGVSVNDKDGICDSTNSGDVRVTVNQDGNEAGIEGIYEGGRTGTDTKMGPGVTGIVTLNGDKMKIDLTITDAKARGMDVKVSDSEVDVNVERDGNHMVATVDVADIKEAGTCLDTDGDVYRFNVNVKTDSTRLVHVDLTAVERNGALSLS